jgi:acyl carrier protein
MSLNETLAQVRDTMADVFDLDDLDTVGVATTADDVEEWDSLSHVRLIVALERKFRVKFSNAEIESLKNVGDLVHLIDSKIG